MTSWNIIPDADIDAESPITESLMFRNRDNPKAVAESDVSVPYADLVLVEGTRTDDNNAGKTLRPDGAGLVEWVAVTSSSQYIMQANNVHGGSGAEVIINTKKAYGIQPPTEIQIAGLGADDENAFFPVAPSVGSIYLSAHDTGGGAGNQVWSADLLSISYDDYVTPTQVTTTYITLYENNTTGPTSVTIDTDDAWHEIHNVFETGGTYSFLEMRSDGDFVYFRCRVRADGAGDRAQGTIKVQVLNF